MYPCTVLTLYITFMLQLERSQFEQTVNHINGIFDEAERVGARTYLEGCLGCITAYLIFMCIQTQYNKVTRQTVTKGSLRNSDINGKENIKINIDVQKMDNAFHWVNLYSEDDLVSFLNTYTYLMDGGLSSV